MSGYVRVETTMGGFEVEVYNKHAPKTANNFVQLAKRGYYDGTTFHRVIPGFMIQGGRGRGSSIYGGKFEDEQTSLRTLKHVGAGVLSMANAGPNTNGSQFFITLAPTPHLDGKHTIFGRISSGMAVVERLGSVVTDRNDRPTTEVKILRAVPVEVR
ncbi:cyclophilin-type peptidyl-prolyl cis-trans isomerase [Chloropicon primus]|uniref:Peptidyl-prolyl cis-trans isomerase n=1 Tax=Chloropicon primus TaxID=1764295 RepID=A0A5B8MKJ9_9CHLO|nr:cyclophilin-type peptidyl-prolyl cis-trans isomerase [Chloropicon primus]|eukprot:QDZ20225.1 cyclophilin-type peptidyl-prolyl cis-trans isomerase [Chloropicon primus]